MSSKKQNHYEVLGIKNDANSSEIKTAFYKLSKEYHPDRNQEDEAIKKFQQINDAYEVLGNYEAKKSYDRSMFPAHVQRHRTSGSTSYSSSPSKPIRTENYTEFYKTRMSDKHTYARKPGGFDSRGDDFNYQSYYQSHYSSNNPNPRIFRNSSTYEEKVMRRNEKLEASYFKNLLLVVMASIVMGLGIIVSAPHTPKVVLEAVEQNKDGNKK